MYPQHGQDNPDYPEGPYQHLPGLSVRSITPGVLAAAAGGG
jgi:hypothetical protein